MNYTLKDASKIRVGDTLTLEDGILHEAVKDTPITTCKWCSMPKEKHRLSIRCVAHSFHFKQIKP